MTYFSVLLTFIIPPLLILAIIVPADLWRGLIRREGQVNWHPYIILGGHVLLALAYTTPWDNYLVATGVWWYDPALVTGITLGYVPIEEYTFFIVQTLLSGLWTIGLIRRFSPAPGTFQPSSPSRRNASILIILLWVISTALWLANWEPGTYLSLILSWAMLPVLVQTWFGADILRHNLRILIPAIAAPTLYLWVVDYLAIQSGTWTIDPAQTTGVMVGILPLEEMVFFLVTNVIIAFGITLMLSPDAQARADKLVEIYRAKRAGAPDTPPTQPAAE